MAHFVLLGVFPAGFRMRRIDVRLPVPLCGGRKHLCDLATSPRLLRHKRSEQKLPISELDTRCVHFELMDGRYLEFVQYFPVNTI